MHIIVLAAGQGFYIDGLNKCLMKDPKDGRRIIDKIIRAFPNYPITMVVGYQAVTIMQDYPQLNYIYNQDWGMTHNSYSLGLALTDEPCYVLSSDLFFEPELIHAMEKAGDNIILTQRRENRILTSINCVMDQGRVLETYQGALRDPSHPEAIGIFKISHSHILREWKKNCLQNRNLYIAQNLPLNKNEAPVLALDKKDHRFFEVNTPLDYLRLIEESRSVFA